MNEFVKIAPVKPPCPYLGGKRLLAKTIIKRIDAIPHDSYIEPFCGMGGVFFRRNKKPKCEVINDFNGEVANFFRVLQRHYVAFMDMLRFSLTSRREFERLSTMKPETLTDLERAARFLYLQRTSFGGKITGQAFGMQPGQGSRFDITKLAPMLEDVYERLSGVVIEALPYQDCIARYDRKNSLFYLDPPYWGTEGDYGKHLFKKDDYQKLADQLSAIKGSFILSINDTPEIREIFGNFKISEVPVTYFINAAKAKKTRELIIGDGRFG